ncbi:MAG: hypothetical protein HQM05_03770, partial [Magnetococcales bacterium]|nr:hypothetical protein [Magnetococcales bacterium]
MSDRFIHTLSVLSAGWRWANFKIGGRIFAGFGVVVVVLALQAMMSHLGLNSVVEQFRAFQASTNHAYAIVEIERSALELQRSVILYTYSGYRGVVQRVLHLQRTLQSQLARAKETVQDGHSQDILRRMAEHFRQYTENFDVAVAEKGLRDELVEDKLNPLNDRMVDALGDLLNRAMR